MTDNDAQDIRRLIRKYGLRRVCQELGLIVRTYAEQLPQYYPAACVLDKLWRALKLVPRENQKSY